MVSPPLFDRKQHPTILLSGYISLRSSHERSPRDTLLLAVLFSPTVLLYAVVALQPALSTVHFL